MRKYFIEFGPKHTRTFIDFPPKKPLGKIVEMSQQDWEQLKPVHPSLWRNDDGFVSALGKKAKSKITFGLPVVGISYIAGLILGALLRGLF